MIQLTQQMEILAARDPVDFRMGIDTLSGLCRQKFSEDPLSGKVFVFYNKRRTSLKILVHDRQGFWLIMKRLSKGRFKCLPTHNGLMTKLAATELQVLLHNGNYKKIELQENWR